MTDNVNEFDICWCRGDEVAGVTCPNASALKSKVMKLAQEHPNKVKIIAENKDGSIYASVPIKCVAVRWPRQISEKQAAAASERFKKMWEEKNKVD